jgi:hypothetical protein
MCDTYGGATGGLFDRLMGRLYNLACGSTRFVKSSFTLSKVMFSREGQNIEVRPLLPKNIKASRDFAVATLKTNLVDLAVLIAL